MKRIHPYTGEIVAWWNYEEDLWEIGLIEDGWRSHYGWRFVVSWPCAGMKSEESIDNILEYKENIKKILKVQ